MNTYHGVGKEIYKMNAWTSSTFRYRKRYWTIRNRILTYQILIVSGFSEEA